ncbi:helix-turn-helix domain-containing protein [Streptococcus saliviloxodontae]|uniref:Transcriptional regulator with XRE-family HTH domain n=1 Tax=Streptococcus saliviloxodontae TaxID=1349416 RepID=A0ABS2PNS0_9STRE|nr:helix-turn-helix transcriptional regulator [Streptococcus saliviloxodontae]MBM7637004.1 transcriptional regulator with XRE-family HTH domain [Streptococcus saliviloxodontae]
MRWDFGKIYKEIRLSKGLSQTEVCANQISRTSLSKFESCQSIPSIENMVFLLDQINMSLEEFHYICHVYQPSKRQEILNQISTILSITGTAELEELQKLCTQYLETTHDIPIESINNILTLVIQLRENGPNNHNELLNQTAQKIWENLEKADNWYYRDFQLLNAILFYFPLENLRLVIDNMLNQLVKYQDFADIKPIKRKLLTNCSTLYLYNNFKVECEKVTLELLNLAKETKRYDSLGFAQVRLGICKGDDNLIEKGLLLLTLTEETALIQTLEYEIKNYR